MAKSYQDYQKEIAELQKKAEEARRAELTGAITQIKSLMAQFNLSIKDLKLKDGKVSRAPGKAVAAKYRDPITGETWSGRGRSPAWVIKAKAENILDALIISGANSAPAKAQIKAAPKKSALKKTVAKPAVKKPAQRKSATKPAEPTAAAAAAASKE